MVSVTNKLGSIRDIMGQDGTIRDHLDYSAFGQKATETQPSNGDRYGFTGRERDIDIAMHAKSSYNQI
jgi:hypothetical protein